MKHTNQLWTPQAFRKIITLLLVTAGWQAAQGQTSTLGIRMVPELTIAGSIGSTNRIQYVDTLKNSSDWKDLTTIVLKVSPTVLFDSNVLAGEARYYRVVNASVGPITNQPAGTPADFVWVAPGAFLMGSPDTDSDRTDFETPQSKVTLNYGFWIGKHEVTQARYQDVTGGNPSSVTDDPELPVDSVTWKEASDYCALLTTRERQSGKLPAGFAYRLPTEAEWEFAARAGKATRFSFGDDLSYSMIDSYAWTTDNGDDASHPVGEKTANAFGLYDIYGNVFEWCQDWFGPYTPEDKLNPKGSVSGTDRVYRGGSWASAPADSRAAARGGLAPESRLSSFGFRVVLAPAL